MSIFNSFFKSNSSAHKDKRKHSNKYSRWHMSSPTTPWGKPALGLKTRKKSRTSKKLIVRRKAVTDVMHPGAVVSTLGIKPLKESPIKVQAKYNESKKIPDNFGDALDFLMNEVDLTVEEMSVITGISTKQIQRWLADPAPRPSVENVMLLCIAMHLSNRYSLKLMKLAGIVLRENSPRESVFLSILAAPVCSISEYNQMLIDKKMRPLTKNEICEEDNVAEVLYAGYDVVDKKEEKNN